jgi:Glycosyl hydrolases family 39
MRCLLSAAVFAASALAKPIAFVADLAGEKETQTFPILDCVGSSHGSTTLRADWRTQLAQFHADTGVRKVRFHGILDDDVSTYLPSTGGQGGANMFVRILLGSSTTRSAHRSSIVTSASIILVLAER